MGPTPVANKNRNYNTAAQLAGTVATVHHGLINANYTNASQASKNDSKGSFQSGYTTGLVLDK